MPLYTFEMEAIRKLTSFGFQWTEPLWQNNLNSVAFFFAFFNGWGGDESSVVTAKKISQISQNYIIPNEIFRILPV